MTSAAVPHSEQRLGRTKGFFAALFDYSFSSFITPRIIKVLYVLATIVVALFTLGEILVAFKISSGLGILTLLVGGPISFVLAMIYVRISLEVVMAFFHIHGDVEEISRRGSGTNGTPLVSTAARAEPGSAHADGPAATASAGAAGPSAPDPAPVAATPATHFCANCGAENSPGKRYCNACGGALD